MANPTDISTSFFAVLEATTTDQTVTLSYDREYTLAHDSETAAGVADGNTIYLANAATVDNDASEGDNKYKLLSGRAVVIGPGITTLHFRTEAGSPTFSISAGPVKFGIH